jgi:hypothetical protein
MELPKTYTEVTTLLESLIETLTLKGYYMEPEEHKIVPYGTLSKVMRQCARDMKRPYVHIRREYSYKNGGYSMSGMSITMPKLKYLAPITNVLMLAAKETDYMRDPIHTRYYTSLWYFRFNNLDLFFDFLEQLHTRPEFRKALRLPDEVTP